MKNLASLKEVESDKPKNLPYDYIADMPRCNCSSNLVLHHEVITVLEQYEPNLSTEDPLKQLLN